jgi:protein-S-isoprenylcysteine O-methyltransferase Ste14
VKVTVTNNTKALVRSVKVIAVAMLIYGWRRLPATVRAPLILSVGMRLSVALWLVFSVYWSIAARDRAATKTSESPSSRRLHLALVSAAQLLLFLRVPGLTQRFLPARDVIVAAGLIVQSAGFALAVWARRHLGRNWSAEVRIAAEHELVRSGPYRYLRHPIYTAVLGMYLGSAVVYGEAHALLALPLVTAAYWRKIRLEERALSETFGADHEIYRRHTWALIPGVY